MIGKNLLWVAKQHGHSVQTMLSTYAAWTEGAKDEDIEVIRAAMGSSPMPAAKESEIPLEIPLKSPLTCTKAGTQFGTDLSQRPRRNCVTRWMREEMYGGKGGTRTLDLGIMSATL